MTSKKKKKRCAHLSVEAFPSDSGTFHSFIFFVLVFVFVVVIFVKSVFIGILFFIGLYNRTKLVKYNR